MLFLAGCLPGSGYRESRELFPSDSLSRQIAAETPVEHLSFVGGTDGPADRPMLLPHSIQVTAEGAYYIADTKRNAIYRFDAEGRFSGVIESPAFGFPYMAGARADTVAVMNRQTDELFFLLDDAVVRRLPLPGGEFVSALATDDRIFYKVTTEGRSGFIASVPDRGVPIDTLVELHEPYWRHIGFLREWNGRLVSLTGYRPVVDILRNEERLDSLALVGFDSPMLPRTRRFMLGQASQLPLLTSSAQPVDSLLFVLNLRPGWLRIDVYDDSGRLHRVLEQKDPEFERRFYPLDMAVHRREDGAYDIAIVGEHLAPRLSIYRWMPGSDAISALPE